MRGHGCCVVLFGGYFPPHPLQDSLGNTREFDEHDHRAFEELLERWGAGEYRQAKRLVQSSIGRRVEPEEFAVPGTKLARAATRITLRQLAARGASMPLVERWQASFDRSDRVSAATG